MCFFSYHGTIFGTIKKSPFLVNMKISISFLSNRIEVVLQISVREIENPSAQVGAVYGRGDM